ncbi:hypothetical protein PRIPAC_96748 [Pristionchus pacificus]|uniref:Uncharacterized protein n=1 Tax=Pristionchus pacificus TaxID=54126 RepID=A0A2A6CU00_PRIPA|nr:hypothetical protein PRIPAC_96748 [Pristionchus pacificus]|eukprot:PDM81629.1 hypothetical protein PRIPAC_30610 [Pristionchus pacificus]
MRQQRLVYYTDLYRLGCWIAHPLAISRQANAAPIMKSPRQSFTISLAPGSRLLTTGTIACPLNE